MSIHFKIEQSQNEEKMEEHDLVLLKNPRWSTSCDVYAPPTKTSFAAKGVPVTRYSHSCVFCHLSFPTKVQVKEHKRITHKGLVSVCPRCDYESFKSFNVEEHFYNRHERRCLMGCVMEGSGIATLNGMQKSFQGQSSSMSLNFRTKLHHIRQ